MKDKLPKVTNEYDSSGESRKVVPVTSNMCDLTVKERLIRFATYKCNDIATFEREAGLKINALRSPNDPTMRVIKPIIKRFPELSLDWLILGTGTMLRSLSATNKEPIEPTECEISKSTQPYQNTCKTITIPCSAYNEFIDQLKVKDQQLHNLTAQIATLLQIVNKK